MKNKLMVYTVIVGDLVRSRDIREREQLSRTVRSALRAVSKQFKAEFYAPVILTRGIDELSGVLKRPLLSYRICKLLNDYMYPHEFRFAVVKGELDIAVNTRDASKMDGPAFHVAADLIQSAKKENRLYCFKIGGSLAKIEPWLNEAVRLVHILHGFRSDRQRQVTQLYEKLERQEKVALKLGITQQAVSDALRKAQWKELRGMEQMIESALGEADP